GWAASHVCARQIISDGGFIRLEALIPSHIKLAASSLTVSPGIIDYHRIYSAGMKQSIY
ncbi:hypothetical protein scyTo_0014074, partial [Scyliorhinus torazame]|nr:hypothetical protein [Scyliorhinus torazame]